MKERRKQPESLRLSAVMPALTVNDIEKSVAFYRDTLGFFVAEEHRQDGKMAGAVLRAGAVQLLLSQDDFAKGHDRKKGVGIRLYCTTRQELDDLAKAIKSRGAELVQEPQDQPWGARDFSLVDPDGFALSISTEPET